MGPTLTADQKDVLAMSKAEYLYTIGSADIGTKLRVAAAVFRIDVESSRPTILLLKRKTNDPRGPGQFEVPLGRVEDSDFFMSDSIARAVKKQAGLKVVRIIGMLRDQHWSDERSGAGDEHLSTAPGVTRSHVQLNWAVAVESTEGIVVSKDEYDTYVWANWNALGSLNLQDSVKDLAKEALTWAARCLV
jgi:8-oxo-dGTP pyrophosphatase MutT (NUDIX family)